jgi:ATP-dependent helicase/nuclease subunit B
MSYRAWIQACCERLAADQSLLLSSRQSLAVWRRVITESSEARHLIDARSAAQWAQTAARELVGAGLRDAANAHATYALPDYRAFLHWWAEYDTRLSDNGWIDLASAPGYLIRNEFRPRHRRLKLLDFSGRRPFSDELGRYLESAGVELVRVSPATSSGQAQRVELATERDELDLAVAWCAAQADGGRRRVALVVASIESERPAIESALQGHPTVDCEFARKAAGRDLPLPGASLSALELLLPGGGFASLSRWLRQPLFQGAAGDAESEAVAAARCEARLRGTVFGQLCPRDAWLDGGLDALMQQLAPRAAERLRKAFQILRNVAADRTPTGWARIWHEAVLALGSPTSDSVVEPQYRVWREALDSLARLTPVLGRIGSQEALTELRAILSERGTNTALPLHGIHVLEHVEDIGPGYDAAWVTGVSASRWPERRKPNPLLPQSLLSAHDLPESTPAAVLDRCRAATTRLASVVPRVIFSSPARDGDGPLGPSLLLGGLPLAAPQELAAYALPVHYPARRIETIPDPAPALAGTALPGGTRALELQSTCPLRAFCEVRLGARELEPVAHGLSRRLRGQVLHAAAERVLAPGTSRSDGGRVDTDRVRRVGVAALEQVFGNVRCLLPALFELELERVVRVIAALLESESERGPFEVAELESKKSVALGQWTLEVRVDRLDRLPDGSVAIIDYKTGGRARPLGWSAERLGDVQVPIYAQSVDRPVGAAIVCVLGSEAPSYWGLAASSTHFPGRRVAVLDSAELAARQQVWRDQLVALAAEYAGGDTRVFEPDRRDAAAGYAPLTRIYTPAHAEGASG